MDMQTNAGERTRTSTGFNPHMDLNHARLPIPPLRLSDCLFGHNAKIEKDLQEEARGKGIWAHCSHHAPHDDRSRAVMNGAIGKP